MSDPDALSDLLKSADVQLQRSERLVQRATRRLSRAPITNLASCEYHFATPKELAACERCDVRTILRMIAAGSLYAYKVGRRWRIPIEEARKAFPQSRSPVAS